MVPIKLLIGLCLMAGNACGWTLKPYNPKPNPAAVVQTNQARFTIFTANMIRMEYNPSGNFEDRASRIFVNRYNQPPKFTVTNGSTIIISTDYLNITYKGGPFSSTSLSISGKVDDINFNYLPSGDVNKDNGWNANLFGTVLGLDDTQGEFKLNCTENYHHGLDKYKHPYCQWGIIGMSGFAVIDDTQTSMMDNDWFSTKPNTNAMDLYFFGHGHNFKQAIYDYTQIAGSVPIMPRYALGSLHTRWYHYSDYSFRSIVHDYQSRSIPLDLAIIDMDWHYLTRVHLPWGDYTWSNLLFPNPNVTQTWFHITKGLRTAANLHDDNGIQTIETYYKQAADALNVTNNQNIPANISDYNYMMVIQDIILDPISEPEPNTNNNNPLAHGFDVWWIDWQQGMDGIYIPNPDITPTYILSYVRGTNNIRLNKNIRNMVLARCGGYGNHRYPVGFSGDQIHDWDSLKYLTYFTPTASNVLFAWSHDIYGGHSSEDLALNTRWIQFGAYSPIFRIHDKGTGTGECGLNIDPIGCSLPDIWTHPFRYFDIERKAIISRAELLPYIYNASFSTYLTGIQLVRSIYIDYPSESLSYPINNPHIKGEYMFGNSMIISPITHPGDLYDVTQQSIFLPSSNNFYEKHSGYIIQKQNSAAIYRNFSLSEIPIYINIKNGIIPISPFTPDDVLGKANRMSYNKLRWDVYPSLDASGGDTLLYEDDGITYNYLNNDNGKMNTFVETKMNWNYNSKTFQFTANVISSGNYTGFESMRYNSIRIYNVLSPKTVECNGNIVNYNVLYFDDDKVNSYYFDGIEIALTINCDLNDVRTNTEIKITFNRDIINDFEYTSLYGLKGKINRAQQCKEALDEVNYEYGTNARSNMTFVASYSMLLGNIGNNYDMQYNYIQQIDNYWKNALNEVKTLNIQSSGHQRYTFCNDLYDSISL